MGWSFRKSFKMGPLRVNLSQGGVGVSAGVKGLRVGANSRGTYVSAGAGGLRYHEYVSRNTASRGRPHSYSTPVHTPAIPSVPLLTSAPVETLSDSVFEEFARQLNEKAAMVPRRHGVAFLGVIAAVLFSALASAITAGLATPVFIIVGIGTAWLYSKTKAEDKKRQAFSLCYNLSADEQEYYQLFMQAFSQLKNNEVVWQHLYPQPAEGEAIELKVLAKRLPIRAINDNKLPAPFFMVNVGMPHLALRDTELFFLPDRIIVKRQERFACMGYDQLQINGELYHFVEEGALPSDATVISSQWRYANKDGSPNRRYKHNWEVPTCAYSEYVISSSTGLFEIIGTSQQLGFDGFAEAVKLMPSMAPPLIQ